MTEATELEAPPETEPDDVLRHSLFSSCERLGPALGLNDVEIAGVLWDLADWYAPRPLAIAAVDPFADGDPYAFAEKEIGGEG